jgi:hypothetical protein
MDSGNNIIPLNLGKMNFRASRVFERCTLGQSCCLAVSLLSLTDQVRVSAMQGGAGPAVFQVFHSILLQTFGRFEYRPRYKLVTRIMRA